MTQFKQIVDIVCEVFKISEQDLLGKSRKQEIVTARHALRSLLYHTLKLKYQRIAFLTGADNHTTIQHSIQTADLLRYQIEQYDKKYCMAASIIKHRLKIDFEIVNHDYFKNKIVDIFPNANLKQIEAFKDLLYEYRNNK